MYGGNFPTHTHFSDVAFDNNGHVLVTGYTDSNFMWTVVPDGAYYHDQMGNSNSALIIEFPSTGDELIWATYFGGTGPDQAFAIEVAENNDRFIAGVGSNSNGSIGDADFPLLEGYSEAYYHESTSGQSGFIAKFNDSNTLIWSTFIEGSSYIVDLLIKQSNNNIAILGGTSSNSLPVINGGNSSALFRSNINGNTDLFYGMLNASEQFTHLTYIGGNGMDFVEHDNIYSNSHKIAEDSQRNTYIIGSASDGIELLPQGNYYFSNSSSLSYTPFVYKIDDVSYELKYGSYLYHWEDNCNSIISSISIDPLDNMVLSGQLGGGYAGNCNETAPIEPYDNAYFQNIIHNNSYTWTFTGSK